MYVLRFFSLEKLSLFTLFSFILFHMPTISYLIIFFSPNETVEPMPSSSQEGQEGWIEELRKCERRLQRSHTQPLHFIHYAKSLHSLGLCDTLLTIIQSAIPSLYSHSSLQFDSDGKRREERRREERKEEERRGEGKRGETSISKSLEMDWEQWRREDVKYLLHLGAQTAASLGRWDSLNDITSSSVDFHLSTFSSRVGQVYLNISQGNLGFEIFSFLYILFSDFYIL